MEQYPQELFLPAQKEEDAAEEIRRPSISYWADVWRRLFQNKLAMTGLVLILLMGLAAIIVPTTTGISYFEQNYDAINVQPGSEFLFGTDNLGRDMLTRVWVGTRYSLIIGLLAALIDFVIGVSYGGIAGMASRRVDTIMMRVAEVVYSIPYMLIVILMSVTFSNQQGVSLMTMVLAMTITGWVPMAILVRGQVLQLKENDYVMASRSMGGKDLFILKNHIIPNTLGPILVNVTLTIPRAIFAEATLSFMSLGLQPPTPSLGVLVSEGLNSLGSTLNLEYQLIIPAIVISLIMFSFNVLGDGMRDALDPRLRK
ncbi:MAG: ABC transporter permease [Tissierellia bacterium]|jgi:dipeptide transport system permease protein|nr:ABC transporter permease [Bacillota bacterium]NLK59009.1 ABC transporter permease [Tissierellia bacterium]